MKALQTDYGCIIIDDKALGKGGRGSVFPIEYSECEIAGLDADQLVFKLIEPRHRSLGRKGKVKTMAAMQRSSDPEICWPLASVYDESEWVGYVMRKANGRPLDETKSDQSVAPNKKARLARRMCELVSYMHIHEIVVGDVNLANFLYDEESGRLALIDLDSVQIADAEQDAVYPTTESRAKSPEMLSGRLGETLLTSRSDDYLLAIEIFRLLFDAHPLDEYDSNTPAEQVRLVNTQNRRFGFSHAASCCGADAFGSELFRLFSASFEGPYEAVPSARDYAECLSTLEKLEEAAFVTCTRCGTQRLAAYAPHKPKPLTTRNRTSRLAAELRPLIPYAAVGALAGIVIAFGCLDPFGITEALACEAGNLRDEAVQFLDKAGDLAQGTIDDVKEAASDLRDEAVRLLGEVREFMDGADEFLNGARDYLNEIREHLGEAAQLLDEALQRLSEELPSLDEVKQCAKDLWAELTS